MTITFYFCIQYNDYKIANNDPLFRFGIHICNLDNTLRHLLPHEKCADLKDHPDVLFSIMVIRIPRKYCCQNDIPVREFIWLFCYNYTEKRPVSLIYL
jgi:hypothetical protein